MSKIIMAVMALVLSLSLNIRSAQAAINTDCTQRGCVFVLTNTAGVTAFYEDDGSSAGSLTSSVGSGQGTISADEGYVIWTRTNSNNVWVYDVAAGGNFACSVNVGTSCAGGKALIFGTYAYQGCGASVKKISLASCTNFVSIPINGTYTGSITRDASTIYVLSAGDGTISTILPPAETSSSFSIGRTADDGLNSLVHVDGILYVSGTAGIYSVPLPLSGSSSLWQALPTEAGTIVTNGSHLALSSMIGDVAYLIPMSSPTSYVTATCIGCGSVAINNDTWYGVSPTVKAWDFTGTERSYSPLTNEISYSIAYLAPTVVPPQCGNDIREGTEVCDGTDLNGETCLTQGFASGTLACNAGCTAFDTSLCTTCGDGVVNNGEDCDGSQLNGETCQSLGHDAGTLSCTAGCTYDESACVDYVCGNDQQEGTEDCDGSDLNGQDCASLGLGTGTLGCTPTFCTFNTSGCSMPPVCGNGTQEPGEQCDNGTANSNTEPDACRTDCTNPRCGDNVTDSGEECDDGNTLNTDGCSSVCTIEVPPNCGDGNLDDGEQCDDGDDNSDTEPDACRTNCRNARCGDGVVDSGEDCDGENLGGQTCEGLGQGFSGGTLACSGSCAFDTSGCTGETCVTEDIVENLGTGLPEGTAFTGVNLTQYTTNVGSLSNSCEMTCKEVNSKQYVEVKTPEGNYCNFKVFGPAGAWYFIWHIYADDQNPDPGIVLVPVAESARARMISLSGNNMFLHNGTDITFYYGRNESLSAGTEGTEGANRIWAFHPDNGVEGPWTETTVVTDKVNYCDPTLPSDMCGSLIPGPYGTAIINIAHPGDLREIGKTPIVPPNKPSCGCSTSTATPNLALMLVLIGLLLVWVRFRAQIMQRVRSRISRRR